jgi:hypothetical protein
MDELRGKKISSVVVTGCYLLEHFAKRKFALPSVRSVRQLRYGGGVFYQIKNLDESFRERAIQRKAFSIEPRLGARKASHYRVNGLVHP